MRFLVGFFIVLLIFEFANGYPERRQYNREHYSRPYYGVYGFPRTRHHEHIKPRHRNFGHGRYGHRRGYGKHHGRSLGYGKPLYRGNAYGGDFSAANPLYIGYGERRSFYRAGHGSRFRPFYGGHEHFYG